MRIPNSKSFRIALMALPLLALSLAAAQCPGGSGTPLTIANFKSGETIGHDLLLLKGVVATTAQQVTMSAGGDPISWPAGGGVYRGFVRLKPGANKVTVSSPGHQNACLDVTFAPNTYAAQVRLACLLPKGYKEGDPLFRAPAGEPNDGASMRKRVGFAALMQQSLIAELLGKAGKGHHSPHIVRDANGEPDVLMLQSDKTKEELEANKSDKAWPSAMSAIREHSDGRTRYMVFYSTMPVVIGIEGGVMKGLDNAYTWPQDLAELHSRWTDLRTPKELSVPGALTETYSLAAMLKSDFGFWFKMIGLFSMGVPNVDTATTDPFGQAYDKLNALFLAKTERGENIIAENVALSAKSTAALAASPVLAIINPARSPALTAAETPAGLIQGVAYKYYEGDYSKLPDFATLTPKASGTTQVFDIQKRAVDDSFAFVFEAYLKVPQAGSYIFQINSDDGSRMLLDGKELILHDGIHNESRKAAGTALEAGLHRIQVQYFNRAGQRGLSVQWAYPGTALQAIPASALQTSPAPIALLPRTSSRGILLRRQPGAAVLTLAGPGHVVLSWVDPSGRFQGELFKGALASGEHRFALPASQIARRNALVLEVRP